MEAGKKSEKPPYFFNSKIHVLTFLKSGYLIVYYQHFPLAAHKIMTHLTTNGILMFNERVNPRD